MVFNRSKFAPFFEILKFSVVGYFSYLYAEQSQNMNVFYIAGCVCVVFCVWVLSYYSAFQVPLDNTEISKDLPAKKETKKVN